MCGKDQRRKLMKFQIKMFRHCKVLSKICGWAITTSHTGFLRVNILNLDFTYKLYLRVKFITFIEFLDSDYIENHPKINRIGYEIQKI